MSATSSNGDFALLQQTLGLTFAKRVSLLDRTLDRLINPAGVYAWPYARAVCRRRCESRDAFDVRSHLCHQGTPSGKHPLIPRQTGSPLE
eukprot:3851170-Pyramimonas_sp.AAC.1